MGVILEATVPVDQFALRDAFEAVPAAEFELMRTIANCGHGTSFAWGTAPDLDRLTDALEAGATTDAVDLVTELEDARLYRLEWATRFGDLLSMLFESDGALLSAHGTDAGWELRFLFPEHGAVPRLHDACDERGLDLTVEGVFQLSGDRQRGRSVLTDKQREALIAAYEAGYYSVPRQTSLQELAAQQSISHQALSELIRRGHRAMIRNAIGTPAGPVDGDRERDDDRERVVGNPTPYSKRRLIQTQL